MAPTSPAYETSTGLARAIGFDHWVGKIFVRAVDRTMARLPEEYTQVNMPVGGPYDYPRVALTPLARGVRIDYAEIDKSNPSQNQISDFWLFRSNRETYVEATLGTSAREPHFTIDTEHHGYNLNNSRANKISIGFAFNTLRMLQKAAKLLETGIPTQQ